MSQNGRNLDLQFGLRDKTNSILEACQVYSKRFLKQPNNQLTPSKSPSLPKHKPPSFLLYANDVYKQTNNHKRQDNPSKVPIAKSDKTSPDPPHTVYSFASAQQNSPA